MTTSKVCVQPYFVCHNIAINHCVFCFSKSYKKDPLGSVLDRLLRWYYGPYRDYILLTPGASSIGDGKYELLDEPSFTIELPRDYFIRPGITMRDNISEDGFAGEFVMEDAIGNLVACNWHRLSDSELKMLKLDEMEGTYKRVQGLTNMMADVGYVNYILLRVSCHG